MRLLAQFFAMRNANFNYVRAFRQRSGLTARDLTHLLGLRSHSVIAKVEAGARDPTLRTAFALQVIFRSAPHSVFAGMWDTVEDETMRRAAGMIKRLERRTDRKSVAKRAYLETLAAGSAGLGV